MDSRFYEKASFIGSAVMGGCFIFSLVTLTYFHSVLFGIVTAALIALRMFFKEEVKEDDINVD